MQTPASTTAMPNGVPTVQRPEHKVAAHIRDAAETTGVPFEFLLAQANQESRLNPEAKSSNSSATGLFQFTAGTWLEMVKKHGTEHGLDQYADAITRGSDGRWTVKDKDLKKEILDLRRDPKLSALMAGEYAKDNEQVLETKLGRQVSTHDLYLAHFLGAGGALKVLKGRNQPEADQQPPELASAAQANPAVFQDPRSGEQRSLASVYTAVETRFRRAMSEAAQVAKRLSPQVDLAALKPEARPDGTKTEAVQANIAQASAAKPIETAALAIAQASGAEVAVTMADIPATVTSYPARLPPRPTLDTATPAADTGEHYPVALPPPMAGARADADTLRGLVSMMEDKG